MMKKIKLLLGLTIMAAMAFLPKLSISKEESPSIVLSKSNLLVVNGVIDGASAGEFIKNLRELDTNLSSAKEKLLGKKPIYVFLYSPGGSIQDGLLMIEAVKGLGRPVHTITLFSASMAFQLAQNMNDRLILENGILMSHHARGEMAGEFGGLSGQLDNRYKLWLDRIKELDEQTVKRTNGKQTYESYTKSYDHELWMLGPQAVKDGYADKVVSVKCDKTLEGVTTHTLFFMGMSLSYDLDNCPLNVTPQNIRINGITILNEESVNQVKDSFLRQYQSKHSQVVPMY